MTDIAIKVENLSKLYRIGQREPYRTLRDTITNAFVSHFSWLAGNSKSEIRNPNWSVDPKFTVGNSSGQVNPQFAIRNPKSEIQLVMTDIAIKVEGLSKLYRIGQREPYRTLRDTLTNAFVSPFRRLRNPKSAIRNPNGLADPPSSISNVDGSSNSNSAIRNPKSDTIWALKDVSFEVRHGEVIGIIGRNGAGKSTLLKILSRITEPTEGYADIYGRVGSLLEVGTGFHPELTGRENIFLNGAILGMKKGEIERKFDEIVAFAEVERFIDTPVKHYSSGMYLRLAFAVAAHLDSETLLVDEVLAVGDIHFQKKCLGKIGDVAKGGRTVIFVSHQMNQIRRLCEKVIWLDWGHIRLMSVTPEVVGDYEATMTFSSVDEARGGDDGSAAGRFLKWAIIQPYTGQPNILDALGPIRLKFILNVNRAINKGYHGIALFNGDNQLMWATAVYHLTLKPGICEFIYEFQTMPIRPGVYHWQVSLYDEKGLVDLWCGVPEMIVATEPLGHPLDMWQGVLNLPWQFQVS